MTNNILVLRRAALVAYNYSRLDKTDDIVAQCNNHATRRFSTNSFKMRYKYLLDLILHLHLSIYTDSKKISDLWQNVHKCTKTSFLSVHFSKGFFPLRRNVPHKENFPCGACAVVKFTVVVIIMYAIAKDACESPVSLSAGLTGSRRTSSLTIDGVTNRSKFSN